RWVSETEPELGMASITQLTDRTVTVVFRASGQVRQYSRRNAPLKRVRFHAGDVIKTDKESSLVVDAVSERDGLLYYNCAQHELSETALSDFIGFSKPEERLFAQQLDPPHVFDLRVATLEHEYRRRKSKVRGFVGGRIELIPHQLYIASEVAGRLAP